MEQKGKTSTQKQNDVIDLVELAQVLWSKIHIIIVCFLVGALVAGGYTKIIVTPQYTATSMIYILGETTSITSVANLQLSSELTADFSMLAKRRKVIEKVNKDLNLGKTYEELCNVITIANPTDTHILTILRMQWQKLWRTTYLQLWQRRSQALQKRRLYRKHHQVRIQGRTL